MYESTLLAFFTDPILRAPTIGCILMCFTSGLIGVIILLRKESLIGEVLSHAAYPGIISGVLLAGLFSVKSSNENILILFLFIGAFLSALLGAWAIQFLVRHLKVPSDAALCFVLSTFFGVGLTLASEIQFSFTTLYRYVLTYLYGQAATMTDIYITVYGGLAVLVLSLIFLFYKEFQLITFDREYAESLGIPVRLLDHLILILVTLSIIIGIRSVGVVLMSAMLIAPAVAARQFSNHLSSIFLLAGGFGMVSGFFGNYFSVKLTEYYLALYPSSRLILPTGPMIVLVASVIAACAICFAPERGVLIRLFRMMQFRYMCLCENILKMLWHRKDQTTTTFKEIAHYQEISTWYLKYLLLRLQYSGWIHLVNQRISLTTDGLHRAAKIVRFHRLWEVYLVNYLGFGVERVHRNAEEIEHIITPELERELTRLLKNPKKDPHAQPIPPY